MPNQNLVETETLVLSGDPLVLYELSMRVRAAVELMAYTGGTVSPVAKRFYIGGSPKSYSNTQVKLEVSDPAATFYLNRTAAVPPAFSVKLDYWTPVILVRGGATLTLSLIRGDLAMTHLDEGGGTVETTLADFDGEYCQLDFTTTLAVDRVEEQRSSLGMCRKWVFSGYEENVLGLQNEK
jgi:hypothetical protein